MDNPMRLLPSIKEIQDSEIYIRWKQRDAISETYLTAVAREVVEIERNKLLNEGTDKDKESLRKKILNAFEQRLQQLLEPVLTPVINGTGVILHTNLGRARLSHDTAEAVRQAASSYTNLEFDIEKGERGSRGDAVEKLLTLITGAESAMVVNNNAAAVFLILRAFAKNKDVIVSRGELVEIGGSFRVSSIMEESDARLVEVGTTNKTRIKDYADSISENTAMLLKVHRSNFKIIGFTEEAERKELADLASKHQIIFYEDLGSGAFFDYREAGIGDEPLISSILGEGVDILSASGDKLFGGPQAGIILGKKRLIDRLKKHQLARTFRVDKMTLAALGKTLQYYLSDQKVKDIPTVRDITQPFDKIKERAMKLKKMLEPIPIFDIELCDMLAYVGGGTMPEVSLKSCGLTFSSPRMNTNEMAYLLRTGAPSVIGRIENEHFILDCCTISDEELPLVQTAFTKLI
ncbi:MAG: L-seryl-tRNA(Sec) selenium transferase [Tuberibacillus sp.]